MAFIRSGGFSLSARVAQVGQDTLVVWGRQDRVLGTQQAGQFEAALPRGRLAWVEECGHVPHLEQPDVLAALVLDFMGATPQATQGNASQSEEEAVVAVSAQQQGSQQ